MREEFEEDCYLRKRIFFQKIDLYYYFIPMNKLIELLNEYRTEKGERNLNEFEVSQTLDSLNYLRLFIDWLVDNDKIDLLKLWKKSDMWFGDKYTREESLLMLLSISDTPIEDLIGYLK